MPKKSTKRTYDDIERDWKAIFHKARIILHPGLEGVTDALFALKSIDIEAYNNARKLMKEWDNMAKKSR